MKTDFCVSLPSSCPGMVFCLLWGGLRSLLDGHMWFVSGLSTIRQVMVWVAPLAVANEAVDCGSVGSSTARWSHVASGQYCGVSSLTTLLWQSSCHGGMGNLFGGHCHRCSISELSSLFCELRFTCVFDIYVLFMCCMSVCFSYVYTCPRCLYEWVIEWYRDGVKVLWYHSHLVWLVFEGSITKCTCFQSEPFSVTCFCCFFLYCCLGMIREKKVGGKAKVKIHCLKSIHMELRIIINSNASNENPNITVPWV